MHLNWLIPANAIMELYLAFERMMLPPPISAHFNSPESFSRFSARPTASKVFSVSFTSLRRIQHSLMLLNDERRKHSTTHLHWSHTSTAIITVLCLCVAGCFLQCNRIRIILPNCNIVDQHENWCDWFMNAKSPCCSILDCIWCWIWICAHCIHIYYF